MSSYVKTDSCGCVYWSDVSLGCGWTTSHRIHYAISESYKKNNRTMTALTRYYHSNGTAVLSIQKSNGHSANSFGLWLMSNVDVHLWCLKPVLSVHPNSHVALSMYIILSCNLVQSPSKTNREQLLHQILFPCTNTSPWIIPFCGSHGTLLPVLYTTKWKIFKPKITKSLAI